MVSPISSTTAEVYPQYLEEIYVKQWLGSKEIVHYKWYVDDIMVINDKNLTNEQVILHQINNIYNNLQF